MHTRPRRKPSTARRSSPPPARSARGFGSCGSRPRVVLATSAVGRVPIRYRGRAAIDWLAASESRHFPIARRFEPAGDGFVSRLVVSYRPRGGLTGLLDRTLVRRGIRRALRATLDNLDRAFFVHPGRMTAAVSRQP
jgi:hypothetical protein